VCGKERGQGGGVTYLERDAAMAEGRDVLAERDSVLLMQTAHAAAQLMDRHVSIVLSGHTHAPCFITSSAHSIGSNRSVLHATLSASGWRMRPDASCALLLLHERATDGSVILPLPLPHEHFCIAVVAVACVAVAVAACVVARSTWCSVRRRRKAN
jgi:hypothetical protein